MKLVKPVVVLVAVVVLLSFMSTAIAPPVNPNCEETVNPHGKTIPPAGWSTLPGDNPRSGMNDDGFFNLSFIMGPGYDYANFTIYDNATGEIIGEIIVTVPIQIPGSNNELWMVNIKYTEANGAEPSMKAMASFDKDNKGQSKAVTAHFKGTGDFGWTAGIWDSGELIYTIPYQTGCLVPPPPR